MPARLFFSSGDLIADRRFDFARDLQRKGELVAAADLMLQATELAPGFASAWFTLGEIRQQLGARDEAIAAFRKAVAARPEDVDAWSGIAFADSETHQYQDELAALTTRSKYAEENPASLFLWTTAYDNLHQRKPAADYYQRFLAAAQGKFPDQEWQAKHRLAALAK